MCYFIGLNLVGVGMEKQHFNIIGRNEIEGSFWIMDNDYSDLFDDFGEDDSDIVYKIQTYRAELERIRHENELLNIHRDKQGRLNKGARLASKDNCNKVEILRMYDEGMTVKQIVNDLRCSKSTVYNAIKKHRK